MARLSAEEMFKNMIGRKDEEPQPAIRDRQRAVPIPNAKIRFHFIFEFLLFICNDRICGWCDSSHGNHFTP